MSSASRSRLSLVCGHGSIAGRRLKGISAPQTRTSWQPLRARSAPPASHLWGTECHRFCKTPHQFAQFPLDLGDWPQCQKSGGLDRRGAAGTILFRLFDIVSKKKRGRKQSFESLARRLLSQFFEDATSPPHQPHFPPVCAPLGPARGIRRIDHPESPSCSSCFSSDPRP